MEIKDSLVDKRIELNKDRGDNLKRLQKIRTATKEHYTPRIKDIPESGDSVLKTLKDKNFAKNTNNKEKRGKNLNKSASLVTKKDIIDKHVNRLLDIDDKKRIREKYMFKPKAFVRHTNFDTKNYSKDLQIDGYHKDKKRNDDSKDKSEHTKSESTKTDRDSDTNEKSRKRPVIKTIIAKNDASKVYKAVTFTVQKQKKPLQIKIPTDTLTRNTKMPKIQSNDIYESKTNKNDKRKPLNKDFYRNLSPVSLVKDNGSPPTEVAKWASSSIDKLSKPYYEAWVNSTLSAISKNSKKDKLFLENKKIIQAFERILERPASPELVYEKFLDERYTGKIRINHKK